MENVFKRNIPNIFLSFGSAISLSVVVCLAYFFMELPFDYWSIVKYWLYLSVLFFLHLLIILLIFELFFNFYGKDKNIEIFNRISSFVDKYAENLGKFVAFSFQAMICALVLLFGFCQINNIFLSGGLILCMYIIYSILLVCLFVYFFLKSY